MKEKVSLCKFWADTIVEVVLRLKPVGKQMNEAHLTITDLFVCDQTHYQFVFVPLIVSMYLIYHLR